MAKITSLRFNKRRSKKVNISLDDRHAFNLEIDVVIKERLKVGQEIAPSQVVALKKAGFRQSCYNAAIRLLSYRPRSEYEMKQRLNQHGFDNDAVNAVLARLKEQNLLDDVNFAIFWRDNRLSTNPRSQCLVRLELKQKGISIEIIDQVVKSIDDTTNAYHAAQNKADKLTITDYQTFRHRLGEYLKRRGFSYQVIIKTIEQLWKEKGEYQEAEIV